MIEFTDNGERHNVSRYALIRAGIPKISRRARGISNSVGFPDKRGDRSTGAKSGVPGPVSVWKSYLKELFLFRVTETGKTYVPSTADLSSGDFARFLTNCKDHLADQGGHLTELEGREYLDAGCFCFLGDGAGSNRPRPLKIL
jgi:hypothetical protein